MFGRFRLLSPIDSGQEVAHVRLVIVESPYAGDVEANVAYARVALADCLRRGEAPFASHLLYTQPGVLDDRVTAERRLGIEAGLAWALRADATVVYCDRGISNGMQLGIDRALAVGRIVEKRWLFDGHGETLNGHGSKSPAIGG